MAFDEYLGERISNSLKSKNVIFEAKKMMGGLCFMVDEKMCVGVVKDTLMARVGEDFYPEAIQKEGCKEMDFTGRPMKGYVFVLPEGIDMDEDLEYYIQLALAFNPQAKARKTFNYFPQLKRTEILLCKPLNEFASP